MVLKYVAIDLATKRQRLVDAPASGSGSGGSATMPALAAAASLSALRVITLNAFGQWVYADAGNADHAHQAIALLTIATAIGQLATPLAQGLATDSAWNWALSLPLFLGSNGQLTQIEPATAVYRVVAFPLTANQLYFNPVEGVLL